MPRRHCGPGWFEDPWLQSQHVVTDYVIAASYLLIAAVGLFVWLPRVYGRWPRAVLVMFVSFVAACGVGHLIDAQMFESPRYRLKGAWNTLTAIISLVTAVFLAARSRSLLSNAKKINDDHERFESTFLHSNIGMCWVRTTGQFLRVNKKFCDIVGYDLDELQRKTYMDITHPDDVDLDNALYARVIAGEIDSYTLDKRYIHKLGHEVWIRLTVSFMRTPSNEIDYAIAQIQDIDIEKRLFLRLEDRVRDLEELRDSSINTGPARTRLDTLLERWHSEDRDD